MAPRSPRNPNEAESGRPAGGSERGGRIGNLLRAWAWLVVLGTAETLLGLSPLPEALRPLLLVPALLMVGVVGFRFMEVTKGPAIVRAFAVGALCWLAILLVLGSVDPFTRPPPGIPTSLSDTSTARAPMPKACGAMHIHLKPKGIEFELHQRWFRPGRPRHA